MKSIFLVVTVGPDYQLLPKFLRYYKNLGVTDFLVILNTQDSAPRNILCEHGISSVGSWIDPFSEYSKQMYERSIVLTHCTQKDWILYADLDEFQFYPRGLATHIKECEKNKINFLEGKLIDRVSSTGELIDLDISKSLEEQFPLGGLLTSNLLKAWDKKVVLAKGKLIIGGGHHLFLDDVKYETLPYKSMLNKHSKGIQIHHFKWDKNLLVRMDKYLKLQDKSLHFWKKEILRFLEHYSKYGKINIQNKRFKFKKLEISIKI
jgi:hypothetical protein